MRKKTAAALLMASLITGGGAALITPGVASAADSTTSTSSSATDRAASRLTAVEDALKGLVTDGKITQDQADKVATTLSEADLGGRGGHGGPRSGAGRVGFEKTAEVIGITVDQLRTGLQDDKTLAQIAEANGKSKADLISGLLEAAKAQLAEDVKAGRITQAQADARTETLTERITARVEQVGRGGPGGTNPDSGTDATPHTATPSPSATS